MFCALAGPILFLKIKKPPEGGFFIFKRGHAENQNVWRIPSCLGRKGRAATASALSLWVVEDKATGIEAILEVYFHAHHIHAVFFIHQHCYAADFIDFVTVFLFVKTQQVRHARATTALHADT